VHGREERAPAGKALALDTGARLAVHNEEVGVIKWRIETAEGELIIAGQQSTMFMAKEVSLRAQDTLAQQRRVGSRIIIEGDGEVWTRSHGFNSTWSKNGEACSKAAQKPVKVRKKHCN
jgi:hypothetical protein